jgi:hypothetical protein
MMRLGRGASLLVALSLLTPAATAYAECAWVLWTEWGYGTAKREVEPSAGYESLPTCEAAIKLLFVGAPLSGSRTGLHQVVDGPFIELRNAQDKLIERRSFRCLPDTVDPRGPKTK